MCFAFVCVGVWVFVCFFHFIVVVVVVIVNAVNFIFTNIVFEN